MMVGTQELVRLNYISQVCKDILERDKIKSSHKSKVEDYKSKIDWCIRHYDEKICVLDSIAQYIISNNFKVYASVITLLKANKKESKFKNLDNVLALTITKGIYLPEFKNRMIDVNA